MINPSKRVHPDRSKINLHQPYELKHWIRTLNVSERDLRAAIAKVGNSAATVRKELGIV